MPNFDPADIRQNRKIGGIGYFPWLFFVPLIGCSNSRYGRYCANQGLLLFLAWLAGSVILRILGWIPLIGWLVSQIIGIYSLALFVIAIYYTYLAIVKGEAREIPVIGRVEIIR